ncbi:MAG: M16 family metallopeptidase [Bacillota bacterium]
MEGKRLFLIIYSLLIILLSSLTTVAASQADQEQLFIPEVDYQQFELDNGLQIYVIEDHTLPLAKFSLWYRVGSIDESEELAGISHLLEHLMFLGTDTLHKDQIHSLIKSAGGVNNAGTFYDYTNYYEELPEAKLELAMAIEADRMRNLQLDSEQFKREKSVVKQERRMRVENSIFNSAKEELQATAFTKSSLQHQIIGWMESLDQISQADVADYYRQYYAPNNAVMVVAGDVQGEEVYNLAQKYYGAYEPQEIERLQIEEVPQKQERTIKVHKATKLPIISLLYKIPRGNHRDIVPIKALLDIWINNATSRVKRKLKQEERMILQAGSYALTLRQPGFALAYAVPMSEEIVKEVRQALDRELEKIIKQGITDEELEIVKKNFLKKSIFNHRDTDKLARKIAQDVIRYDNPTFYQTEIKRWQQLSKEEIIKVANKYFTADNRTVGYILPQED